MRATDSDFYKRTLTTLPSDELYDLKRRSAKYPGLLNLIDVIIDERNCHNQHTQNSATAQAKIMLNLEHDSRNNLEPISVQSH